MATKPSLVFALPKGRIAEELLPVLEQVGIIPEKAFFDAHSRQLQFATNIPGLTIVRVRSFDVATFVAFGAAQFGVAGQDVLMEFEYPDIYSPLDLKIGACRISIAEPVELAQNENLSRLSHMRIATKYPEITRKHFAARGIQAECIKLNGAMELAPAMGLCERIVDLVGTGKTLRENGLIEVEKIADISSHLILNRNSFKTRMTEMNEWIERFKVAVNG